MRAALVRRIAGVLAAPAALLVAAPGAAKDVARVRGAPLRVDITETALFNWHGDNLNSIRRLDDNYGEIISRFNVLMAWQAWQFGLRLDTVKYFDAPSTGDFTTAAGFDRAQIRDANRQLPYRYRDTFLVEPGFSPRGSDPAIFPSKIWISRITPDLEVTLGDAYVAFGRGFVLNMRKFDEIGADTTLQGGKVIGRLKHFTFTGVAGLSNPTRVDDATGFKLVNPEHDAAGNRIVTWSRDVIAGGRAEAKVGTNSIGVHAANIHRREPGLGADPSFVRDVLGVGANVAIPRLSDALPLNLYAEGAIQNRYPFASTDPNVPTDPTKSGYAAYAAASLTTGAVTTTLEGKHYRSFVPVRLNADPSRYFAFQGVQYTANPTVELITQDSLFDNSCTTGGRARIDVKVQDGYTAFASYGRFANWQLQCGAGPTLGISERLPDDRLDRHDINDLYVGFDLRSQTDTSYLTVMLGTRRENRASGESYYREGWVQATGSKTITGLFSVEVDAWHRNRYLNLESWREGQTYLSFKYASKYAGILGHEYSTRDSQISPPGTVIPSDPMRWLRYLPTDGVQHFLNVGGQVKFGDDVMIRFLFGEQRAALKCVSGVCRFFPAFAGARTEVIVRY